MKRIIMLAMFLSLGLINSCSAEAQVIHWDGVRNQQETVEKTAENEVVPVSAGKKMLVVPYVDMSEERKSYVRKTVASKYEKYFAEAGFVVTSAEEMKKAFEEVGFDTTDKVLPDKDIMAGMADVSGVDYVVAAELSDVDASRHSSRFARKIHATCKLKYHFYQVKNNKYSVFQVTGEDTNKAVVVGNVGYKDPIEAAIRKAMDAANSKINTLIEKNI